MYTAPLFFLQIRNYIRKINCTNELLTKLFPHFKITELNRNIFVLKNIVLGHDPKRKSRAGGIEYLIK